MGGDRGVRGFGSSSRADRLFGRSRYPFAYFWKLAFSISFPEAFVVILGRVAFAVTDVVPPR